MTAVQILLTPQSCSDLKVLQGYTSSTEGLFPCYQNYLHGLGWKRKTGLYNLTVLGTCTSENGSKTVLQSLRLHFETQFIFHAQVKGCWK